MRILMLEHFRGPETGETIWLPGEEHDTNDEIALYLIGHGKAEPVETDEREPDGPKKGRKKAAEPAAPAVIDETPSKPTGAYAKGK